MKALRIIAVLAAPAALLLPALAAADTGPAAVVTVQQESVVRGGVITLGDIGSIETDNRDVAERLESLRLGVSPMPGSWRELEREQIVSQLLQNGFSPNRVSLSCPSVVRIFRESRTVTMAELESRLRDYIYANAPWAAEEMEIAEVSRPADQVVPAGDLGIEISPRGSVNYLGRTPFAVEIKVGGERVRQLVMQAEIRVMRDAVVALTPIPPHRVIDGSDVEVRRVDIGSLRGKAFQSVEEVAGMAATCNISAGQVVEARMLAQPILVHRGDTVQLEASRPGFVIRATGVAQSDGRLGEIISFKNPLNPAKTLDAEVVGANKARVIF